MDAEEDQSNSLIGSSSSSSSIGITPSDNLTRNLTQTNNHNNNISATSLNSSSHSSSYGNQENGLTKYFIFNQNS